MKGPQAFSNLCSKALLKVIYSMLPSSLWPALVFLVLLWAVMSVSSIQAPDLELAASW